MTESLAGLLERAVALARANAEAGQEPFGSLVVRDGEILGEGVNTTRRDADPTAHAEVAAVRAACRRLGAVDLGGATVVTSCEPCPMCRTVAVLAGVSRIVYAVRAEVAAGYRFALSPTGVRSWPPGRSRTCSSTLRRRRRGAVRALCRSGRRAPSATCPRAADGRDRRGLRPGAGLLPGRAGPAGDRGVGGRGRPRRHPRRRPGNARASVRGAGRADRRRRGGGEVAGPVRLALEVDDSAATARRLVEAGAEALAEPVVTPWNDLNVRLRAPGAMQLTLFTPTRVE